MNKALIASIILAGGQGKRLNSKEVNKVVYPFIGKPMILYGVELFKKVSSYVVVVVGAFADSVKEVLKNQEDVVYAFQEEQLGTGDAAREGLKAIKSQPKLVLIGYGDHLMFYKDETLRKLIELHEKDDAVVTFITTKYEKPEDLAWGHVDRDSNGKVIDIIEHKDANEEQKKIKELNASLYCFDYDLLQSHIQSIHKSPVTGEYYLTDIIKVALADKKSVSALIVPFEEVGIGVNRMEELEESQKIFKETHED